MTIRQIAVKATAWVVRAVVAIVTGVAFVNLPDSLRLCTSVIVAGLLIAAAVISSPASVVNVYGDGWRVRKGGEE